MTGKHKYIPDRSAHRCRSWVLQISCADLQGPFSESPDAQRMFYVQEDRGYTGTAGFWRKKYGHVVNSTTNPHIQATNIGRRKEASRGISSTYSFQKFWVLTVCQTFSKDIFLPVTKFLKLEKYVSCHSEITVQFRELEYWHTICPWFMISPGKWSYDFLLSNYPSCFS